MDEWYWSLNVALPKSMTLMPLSSGRAREDDLQGMRSGEVQPEGNLQICPFEAEGPRLRPNCGVLSSLAVGVAGRPSHTGLGGGHPCVMPSGRSAYDQRS